MKSRAYKKGIIMKKIIVLIVLVIIVLVVLKMMGGDTSVSVEPFASRLNEDKALDDYDLALSDDLTYKDIIGYTLPETVGDIRACITFYGAIWRGFVAAEVPGDIFDILIEKLGLQSEPKLLELWPEAFECKENEFKNRYWDSVQINKGEFYYFGHPAEETRIAVSYGNEKLYFVKETKYTGGGRDERGFNLYKKAKRAE